jgi:organic hydroperoxide reductase OsmC/OhrA
LEKVEIGAVTVTADVTINADENGFNLAVTLKTHVAGVDKVMAERLAHKAHNEICPYSKATRNNIPVRIEIV